LKGLVAVRQALSPYSLDSIFLLEAFISKGIRCSRMVALMNKWMADVMLMPAASQNASNSFLRSESIRKDNPICAMILSSSTVVLRE
jgi:hypothetical protein